MFIQDHTVLWATKVSQKNGTLPKISFLKLQGRGGSNNNPGLDGGRLYGLRS